MYKLEKIKFPKNQLSKEEMVKWTDEKFFKGGSTNGQQIHKEMFNIPGQKGNANQNKNHIKIFTPLQSAWLPSKI
jgi:hypothetical protein